MSLRTQWCGLFLPGLLVVTSLGPFKLVMDVLPVFPMSVCLADAQHGITPSGQAPRPGSLPKSEAQSPLLPCPTS